MQRFDPFRVLDAGARDADLSAHRAMMADRAGGLDLERRQLTERAAFLLRLDSRPVRWRGPLDRPAYLRNLRGDSTPVEDARVAWLLAAAKSVESADYDIELELKHLSRRERTSLHEHRLFVALEDRGHSRVLERACRVFGIQLRPRRARLASRLLTRLVRALPAVVRMPFLLCNEVVDAVLVGILLDRCDLFHDQPEVEQRLRLLLGEILVDETGHVAFSRARVHPVLLPLARHLAPSVAASALRDIPEFASLAGGREEVLRRVRDRLPVPDPVRWIEPEASAS